MIYAIGDIHGKHDLLDTMLKTLKEKGMTDDDTLVFLGDYIDGGKGSRDVLDSLRQRQEQRGRVILLRGNHEQMMLDARRGPQPHCAVDQDFEIPEGPMGFWVRNGGWATLASYGVDDHIDDWLHWQERVPEEHWAMLDETKLEYVTPRYHFVHAGLLPSGADWKPEPYKSDPRLWIQEPFLSSTQLFNGRIVVFGHTRQESGRPLINSNKIGLDTAGIAGPLSAVNLSPDTPEAEPIADRIFQVYP